MLHFNTMRRLLPGTLKRAIIMVGIIGIIACASCQNDAERRVREQARFHKEMAKVWYAIHEYVSITNDVPRDANGVVSLDPLFDFVGEKYLPLQSGEFVKDSRVAGFVPKVAINPKLQAKDVSDKRKRDLVLVATVPGFVLEIDAQKPEIAYFLRNEAAMLRHVPVDSEKYKKWFANFERQDQDESQIYNENGHLKLDFSPLFQNK